MDLNETQAYARIFQALVTGCGTIVGGTWVYYKFVKGRLFSPRIELSLTHNVVKAESKYIFVGLEVTLKNIGSVRLLPSSCRLDLIAFSMVDGQLGEHQIPLRDGENIIPFENNPSGTYYIDPGEASFRSRHIAIGSEYVALSVLVQVEYNKSATERKFYIDLKDSAKSGAAEQNVGPESRARVS